MDLYDEETVLRGVCTALLLCVWVTHAGAASSMNPNLMDVGGVMLGNTGMRTGTLSSNSNDRVDLSIQNCTGAAGTFVFDRDTNINLNNSQTITLSYTPNPTTGRGQRDCTVRIYDTGTTTQLGSFSIRGTGQIDSTMSVSATTTVDFGQARWNDAAPATVDRTTRSINVSNTGDIAFTLNSVTGTGDFAGITGATGTILPGNARSFTVTFDPSMPGTRTGTITFSSDAANNPSQGVNTTGIGTNAVISVTDPAYGTVANGSVNTQDVVITNIGVATKGPLGVTGATITGGAGWFTFSGCGGGTTCNLTIPFSITNGNAAIGVRCSPPLAAAIGEMQMATITINSDTDDITDRSANVMCVAGQSELATSMGTFTFAPQLVGTASGALPVTVSNRGNLPATYYFQKTGLYQGMFTITSPGNCGFTGTTNQCTVPAATGPTTPGTMMFSMTYTPTIEGDVSAGITLVSSSAVDPQFAAAGRGIDRHIAVTDMMQANDTFRNPGSKATLVPIEISNLGEYPLHISNMQLGTEDSEIWSFEVPFAPFDVPGLDKKTVNLRFAPKFAGKAPDATVVLNSDDRLMGMNTIIVSGNGKDRNVEMTPGNIDFGNTGAGVPVLLSAIKTNDELLTLVNLDEADFKIARFEFNEGDGLGDAFTVQDSSGDTISNRDLPMGATQKFDIVFAPPKVGVYTRQLTLFLDEDPLGQRTIQVQGNALFVDARGGGGFGCSTGGGAGAGVLFGLLALRRRRRA